MAKSNSAGFKVLEEQYFTLRRNFNKLFKACETEKQRNKLRDTYVTARDNYYAARTAILEDNDPAVKEMIAELKAAQKEIKKSLKDLKNIVKVLEVITQAVRLGSSLLIP